MKVLLVGGGGREHALAWRLTRDDPAIEIVAAPGNPGIASMAGNAQCAPVSATDINALMGLARQHRVDFTIVGPEAPLADGIVDRFRAGGLAIFGPTRAAAEIETSKAFAKDVMRAANVPTAHAVICTDSGKAKAAAREFGAPVVIKASGLAAGKGVIVCATLTEADRAIDLMLVGNAFGDAGHEVLVEEFMAGEELSVLALTDGVTALPLVPAQDHKRLLDGDAGPNTGGMGAYAPVSIATPALMDRVQREVLQPTLAEMAARGRPFTGVLYAGLMLTSTGPRVVEFNCRFGDPETQVVLPVSATSTPFIDLLWTIARGGRLPSGVTCEPSCAAVTTVLAARGYPENPSQGDKIFIPPSLKQAIVFHAGTAPGPKGSIVSSGGRVLSVTGLGATVREAKARSLTAAELIEFDGRQYRSDIGWRELQRHAGAA